MLFHNPYILKFIRIKEGIKIKQIIALAMILLFANAVFAQNETNITTTSTIAFPFHIGLPASLAGIYSFLTSINPILLIIFGIVLILASTLAKYVGIVLIIIAIVSLFFLFFH
jgi:hypothetical protein